MGIWIAIIRSPTKCSVGYAVEPPWPINIEFVLIYSFLDGIADRIRIHAFCLCFSSDRTLWHDMYRMFMSGIVLWIAIPVIKEISKLFNTRFCNTTILKRRWKTNMYIGTATETKRARQLRFLQSSHRQYTPVRYNRKYICSYIEPVLLISQHKTWFNYKYTAWINVFGTAQLLVHFISRGS